MWSVISHLAVLVTPFEAMLPCILLVMDIKNPASGEAIRAGIWCGLVVKLSK